MNRLIVDTCVWYALFDESDDKHKFADNIRKWIEIPKLVIPYPSLYETLNTRFTHNKYHQMENLFSYLEDHEKVEFVYDEKYRDIAYNSMLAKANTYSHYSLVDSVIRLMLEDDFIDVNSVLTFNIGDFSGLRRVVNVISPEWDMESYNR